MYSIVLATALVTMASTPDFCHGRRGGYSSCYASCGCYGCQGCYGYAPAYGYAGTGYAAFGNFFGAPAYYGGCTGCYGCYGGHSGYGIPVPMVGVPAGRVPAARDPYPPINPGQKKVDPQAEEVGVPKEKKKPKGKDEKFDEKKVDPAKKPGLEEEAQARARVRITVPEGGKLYVDGRHINVKPGVRVFRTPLLSAGESYFYDIRLDVTRNGILRRDERRVVIHPGQDVAVNFDHARPPGTLSAQLPR